MSLTFADPRALALLLALPLVALISFAVRRSDRGGPGDHLALGVRLAILASVTLSLAQPAFAMPNQSLSVVFAVDASDSLGPQERARALAFVQRALGAMRGGDQAGVVAFGKEARVLRPVQAAGSAASSQPLRLPDGLGAATDIAAGLKLAASLLLPDGARRIVLVSDGQDNGGQVLDEARQLEAGGIQVVTVPVGKMPNPEVVVDGIEVAPYTRAEEPIDLAVTVESGSDSAGQLRIWLDGDLVVSQQIELKAGGNRYSTTLKSLSEGFHAFRAQVSGAPDTYTQNDESYAFTVVKPAARVLLVASNPNAAAPLQGILGRNGFRVSVQSPKATPSTLAPLKGYDGMALVDVSAKDMSLDQMRTIQGFVQTLGRGLFVVGGESSYGLGGYDGSPLDQILPVKVKSPASNDIPQVAMVLVVDRSGSMDERLADSITKIQAARQSAVLATNSLTSQDYLGVVSFDTVSTWLVPPRQVGDSASRAQIQSSIQTLTASGGTELYPALVQAYQALKGINAQYKYIIAMTDGVSFTKGDYDSLAAQMKAAKVTLSTIAIGQDADQPLLQHLAQVGQGRYYYADRASALPQITVQEAQLASVSPKLEGDITAEVHAQSPILRALPTNLPPLKGIDVTTPRDTAMTALTSQRGDVLLAHWQVGLGRVVAWTSDVGGKWTADWTSRADLDPLWTQALRWSFGSPQTSGLYIHGTDDGASTLLEVQAVDDSGALLNLLDLRATVGGDSQQIPLVQVAPGRYRARIALPGPGAYQVSVVEYGGGKPTSRTEDGGIVVSYPLEYRYFGVNEAMLASMASTTGGTLTAAEQAFARQGLHFAGKVSTPLWPYLLGLAAILFPLDVAVRRLRLSASSLVRPVREATSRVSNVVPLRRRRAAAEGESASESDKAA